MDTTPGGHFEDHTDGAFRAETLSGGWGFTIRNHEGGLMAAGAGNLEFVSDALHAEALAMLHAVNTTNQLGCDREMFETDSVSLKQAVTSEAYDLSTLGDVFREIKFRLRASMSDLCIRHCPRSCNQAAHMLAAHGMVLSMGSCEIWLGQFPNFVLDVVAGDLPSNAM